MANRQLWNHHINLIADQIIMEFWNTIQRSDVITLNMKIHIPLYDVIVLENTNTNCGNTTKTILRRLRRRLQVWRKQLLNIQGKNIDENRNKMLIVINMFQNILLRFSSIFFPYIFKSCFLQTYLWKKKGKIVCT